MRQNPLVLRYVSVAQRVILELCFLITLLEDSTVDEDPLGVLFRGALMSGIEAGRWCQTVSSFADRYVASSLIHI